MVKGKEYETEVEGSFLEGDSTGWVSFRPQNVHVIGDLAVAKLSKDSLFVFLENCVRKFHPLETSSKAETAYGTRVFLHFLREWEPNPEFINIIPLSLSSIESHLGIFCHIQNDLQLGQKR